MKITDREWADLAARFPESGRPCWCEAGCGRRAAPWPWLCTKPAEFRPYTLRLCLRCAADTLWTADPLLVVIVERTTRDVADELAVKKLEEEDRLLEEARERSRRSA